MGIFDFLKRDQNPKRIKKRNYGGARGGRLFGDFIGSSFSADSELRYNLEVLRNRSRELVRDNEFAKRYINLIKTNVVGDKGFHLQVIARNDDGSLDRAGNAIIENAWRSCAPCRCRSTQADFVVLAQNFMLHITPAEARLQILDYMYTILQ